MIHPAIQVGAEAEPAAGGIVAHQGFEAGFVNRNPSGLKCGYLCGIHIHAEYVVAHLRKAGAGNKTDIAGSE